MRALFSEYCSELRDGTYILVAKNTTPDTPYETLKKDFYKILMKTGAIVND